MVGTLVGGCRCATSWCDLHLTFDLAIVTLTVKILSRLYVRNCNIKGCMNPICDRFISVTDCLLSKCSVPKKNGQEQTDFKCKSLSPDWTRDCTLCSVPPYWTRVQKNSKDLSHINKYYKISCCNSASIVKGQPQKKGVSLAVVS